MHATDNLARCRVSRYTEHTMTLRAALLPIVLMTSSAACLGQSSTHTGASAHRSATGATKKTVPAVNPADNPPGVPPVHTMPKVLYSLRYVDIIPGTGELVPPQKFYTVRYTGWLTDGTKFDSSYDHPGQEPITFFDGAHRVIAGWDTGFTGMRVGGKRRLYIPYQLAYGESGREGAIPPKADLIFDIELVSFSDTPKPPAAAPVPATQTQPDAPTAQPSTNPN